MKQTFTDAELRVMDQFARGIENEIKKANFRKGVEKVFGQNTVVDKALSSMDVASAIMGAIKNALMATVLVALPERRRDLQRLRR